MDEGEDYRNIYSHSERNGLFQPLAGEIIIIFLPLSFVQTWKIPKALRILILGFASFSQLKGTDTRKALWKTESTNKNIFETKNRSQISPSNHSMIL